MNYFAQGHVAYAETEELIACPVIGGAPKPSIGDSMSPLCSRCGETYGKHSGLSCPSTAAVDASKEQLWFCKSKPSPNEARWVISDIVKHLGSNFVSLDNGMIVRLKSHSPMCFVFELPYQVLSVCSQKDVLVCVSTTALLCSQLTTGTVRTASFKVPQLAGAVALKQDSSILLSWPDLNRCFDVRVRYGMCLRLCLPCWFAHSLCGFDDCSTSLASSCDSLKLGAAPLAPISADGSDPAEMQHARALLDILAGCARPFTGSSDNHESVFAFDVNFHVRLCLYCRKRALLASSAAAVHD